MFSLSRSLCLLSLSLLGALLSPAVAQTAGPDTTPPVIELEALDETIADRSQVFTAQIADDRTLDSAALYHRREGQRPFSRLAMRPLGATGYFTVTLATDPSDLRPIEYYVQALDDSGNRTVSGYAFDPFRRTLRPAATPIASGERGGAPSAGTSGGAPPAGETALSSRPRWWAVVLGVVAVGALASLAGGGGDDGGGGGDRGTVPLTIDLTEPVAR